MLRRAFRHPADDGSPPEPMNELDHAAIVRQHVSAQLVETLDARVVKQQACQPCPNAPCLPRIRSCDSKLAVAPIGVGRSVSGAEASSRFAYQRLRNSLGQYVFLVLIDDSTEGTDGIAAIRLLPSGCSPGFLPFIQEDSGEAVRCGHPADGP